MCSIYLVVITRIIANTRTPLIKHDANKHSPSQRDFVSEAFFQKYGRIIALKTAIHTYNELDIVLTSFPMLLSEDFLLQ